MNASRRIASRFHGSRPITNGAIARERGLDRRRVGAAARLAPADEPVVGRQLHEHVADAVSRDLRADLAVAVGNADGDRLDGRDPSQGVLELRQDLVAVLADDGRRARVGCRPSRADRWRARAPAPSLPRAGSLAVRRDARLLRPGCADAVSGVVVVGRAVLGEHLAHVPVDVLRDRHPACRARSPSSSARRTAIEALPRHRIGAPTKTALAVSDQPPSIQGEVSVRTRSPVCDQPRGRVPPPVAVASAPVVTVRIAGTRRPASLEHRCRGERLPPRPRSALAAAWSLTACWTTSESRHARRIASRFVSSPALPAAATRSSQATGERPASRSHSETAWGRWRASTPIASARETGIVERGQQGGAKLACGIRSLLEVVRSIGHDPCGRGEHVAGVEVGDDRGPRRRACR